MNLGKVIYQARKLSKLKQKEFANKLEIDKTYLSQLENNKKTPSIKLLEKMSHEIEIPLPILFFSSLSEEDVPENKKQLFRILFPKIEEMVQDIFSTNSEL